MKESATSGPRTALRSALCDAKSPFCLTRRDMRMVRVSRQIQIEALADGNNERYIALRAMHTLTAFQDVSLSFARTIAKSTITAG
jgi:hypothetical protein